MKFVLGGGISGLVWTYYHKDHCVITPDTGGQFGNVFSLGARYLHQNLEARAFIRGFGLPIEERTIRVGYSLNSELQSSPPDCFRELYYKKSRATQDLEGFDETSMNAGKNEFQALNVDFKNLIEKLSADVTKQIIPGKVERIDLKEKWLYCDHFRTPYQEVVSTMPLNIFLKAAGMSDEASKLKSLGITYVLLDESFKDLKQFDFAYFAGDEPYHRLGRDENGLVAELTDKRSNKELLQFFGNAYKNHKYVPGAQLLTKKPSLSFDGVKFLGRYGAWDRSYKTEKVIQEAIQSNIRQSVGKGTCWCP